MSTCDFLQYFPRSTLQDTPLTIEMKSLFEYTLEMYCGESRVRPNAPASKVNLGLSKADQSPEKS